MNDTIFWFAKEDEAHKIIKSDPTNPTDPKTLSFNGWNFDVSNNNGILTFTLVSVDSGAAETISLPIYAESHYATNTAWKAHNNVSYAIARKGENGEPAVSIDFDNNNATLLYNSSKGVYANSAVANVSVLVGSEDKSNTATITFKSHGVNATITRDGATKFISDGAEVTSPDRTGIISVKATSLKDDSTSSGYITATYTDSSGIDYTATFNVTRSVGRYAVDIIATPTQISYNQTTGIASSNKVVAKINAIDINGKKTDGAAFSTFGAMKWRYVGADWTTYAPDPNSGQSASVLEIKNLDFTKSGVEFSFVDGSRNQLDYETVPFSSVSNGGDAYLVNAASMNIALTLSQISYGTPLGDVPNVIYMTKNNVIVTEGIKYKLPGSNATIDASHTSAKVTYDSWMFDYNFSDDGRLNIKLEKVNKGAPTSMQLPIEVIYGTGTDSITRIIYVSYTAIQKGPAGRSYKPNTPVLFEEGKEYKWDDEYRDFIYYAFKVNDKGDQDDENGALSYFMYGVKEYGMTKVKTPPEFKGGDDNWEYVSEYKSIIVNCLFGTNAIIGGFLMTNRTATASNGECGLVLDGNEGSITSVGENSKTVLVGGLMTIFNNLNGTWRKNIEFGIKNGYAVMSYYDNNGNLLYDLGPSGLTGSSLKESKFEEIKIKKTGIIWASARLNQQGQWNTDTGTIYNKINDNYDSTIFGGGSGSIPYDRVGSTFTSVSIYRYTAARINGTAVAEPSLGLSTAAMAEKADGMYFTSKTTLGNSSGSLVNLASDIYGVTSDRRVNLSLISLTEEYVPKYRVLFNSFLNGKQSTVRVSGKTVIKVSTGANGMVPID